MKDIRFDIALAYLILAQFALVYSVAEPHELKKMTGGVRKKCLAETGVDVNVVDESEIGVFPEDEKLKCYYKCILEKFNMFTKKNGLNYDLMKKIVPEHFKQIGLDMIDSCTGTTGPNRCEIAFTFMKCLYVANPVAFFVV